MKKLNIMLNNGEMAELHGNDNIIIMWKSKETKRFICELNGKVMFSLKTFSAFNKNLLKLTEKHGIDFRNN